jgi:hypothetical protein
MKKTLKQLIKDNYCKLNSIKEDLHDLNTLTDINKDHVNVPKNIPGDVHDSINAMGEYKKKMTELDKKRGRMDDFNYGLHRYTDHDDELNEPKSRRLNRALASGKSEDELLPVDLKMHKAIHAAKHEAGEDIHLYSGTRHDFSKMAKASKDGVLVSPAHISTSIDPSEAEVFAKNYKGLTYTPNTIVHMNHIHVKPHDKILSMGGYNKYDEHEVIVPSGTKLKYHGTTKHKSGGVHELHMHHFTIESQE